MMTRKRRRADQRTPAPPPPPPLRTKLSRRQPVVVFAHGAGAPTSSDWTTHWKEMVKDSLDAIEVVTFDYPCLPQRRTSSSIHVSVVKNAVAEHPDHPLVLMGNSMVLRVSCMLASSDGISVSAVICLGYPLKGGEKGSEGRDTSKADVSNNVCAGNKDGLCPLDMLELTRKKMTCHNGLHVVDGGDHSIKISQRYQNLRE